MAVRRRRVEQVEHNRHIVLAAARRVFIQRGYAGASLDSIAEEAGFSKGVVYSQFGSKPDLFFALLEQRIEERAAQNRRAVGESSGASALRELLRIGEQDAAEEPGWIYVLTEFRALAMRDPELARRYASMHQRTVEGIASVFEDIYQRAGRQPPVSVQSIAELMLAGGAGVALERSTRADAIPDRDIAILLPRALGLSAEAPRTDRESHT